MSASADDHGGRPAFDPSVLCSTGVFTRWPHATDARPILELGPTLPADGLEILVYPDWAPQIDAIAEALCASGMRLPVVHARKGIGHALAQGGAIAEAGLRSLGDDCRFARRIAAGLVVLHLWELPTSDLQYDANLAALPSCIDIGIDTGVQIAVETLPCLRRDALTATLLALETDPRCLVVLDTEFLGMDGQLGEALETAELWKLDAVAHIHVKDYDGIAADASGYRRYLLPGEGHLDLAAFFRGLAERRYARTLSLEASVVDQSGVVDAAALQLGLVRLRDLVATAGKAEDRCAEGPPRTLAPGTST